jgi:hypothetical protein
MRHPTDNREEKRARGREWLQEAKCFDGVSDGHACGLPATWVCKMPDRKSPLEQNPLCDYHAEEHRRLWGCDTVALPRRVE